MKKRGKFITRILSGGAVGAVNGLFGAGGGIVLVPLLMKSGLERKTAHKNAVAVILPITVVSAIGYLTSGHVELLDAVKYIPGGLIGAILGSLLLNKLPQKWLRRIFGAFMVWAGWRLIF